MGQMPVGRATVFGPEHYAGTQGRSAQFQGLRQRQHRTEHKGHTPNPRTEIKIPDPTGNRSRTAGLEGRDSTDHAKATTLHLSSQYLEVISLIGFNSSQ